MIPSVEEIVAGLLAGQFTQEQATKWLNTHMELAAERVPLGVEWPPQGSMEGEEFRWDFPLLHFGHGKIEVGDATWDGLPALFFGRNGLGLGVERDREALGIALAENGETLALFTFANLQGLEAVESAVARVRQSMEKAVA